MAREYKNGDVVIYEDRWEVPHIYYIGVVTHEREADDHLVYVKWMNPRIMEWLEPQLISVLNIEFVGSLPDGTELDW